MNKLIDTHAHLYVEQFDGDQQEMLDRAFSAGIEEIYLPNIDEATIEPMMKLSQRFPQQLFPMMGLHPCSVEKDYELVLDRMEAGITAHRYYGIGETGIDLYWDESTKEIQIKSFVRQIQWAKKYRLPIVIHSRSALDVTIALIEEHQSEELTGIFHCFDGTEEQARRIINTGFYIGIGGVITYKKSHLPELISTIGIDRVVLETDAPYLSPVPKRGKRNESSYLSFVAEFIAQTLNMTLTTVTQITTLNARKIFIR
jgi:TatD DNase family protein